MNNLRIFYNISGDYWVELPTSELDMRIRLYKMSLSQLEPYDGKTENGETINSLSVLNCNNEKKYHITLLKLDDDRDAFCLEENFEEKECDAEKEGRKEKIRSACNSFRLKHRSKLLKNIFTDECDIKQTLEEIRKYLFCKHYSLWLYNHTAKCYTHMFSSFEPKHTDWKDEENKLFAEEMENNELKSIKSSPTIQIKLNTSAEEGKINFLTLKFFSEYEDYPIKKETESLIKEIVNLKFSKDNLPRIIKSNETIMNLTKTFSLGKFDDYLKECVDTITTKLNWEAASIFIRDDNDNLMLKALKHYERGIYTDKYTEKNIKIGDLVYKKNMKGNSITYDVFCNDVPKLSYDINSEQNNSRTFNEGTKNEALNWIGMPISAPNIKSIGVLRAKNKLNNDEKAIPFNDFDVSFLKNLAQSIAYQYNNDKKIVDKDKFVRTTRHEIKTPLTFVTSVSTMLENMIRKEFKMVPTNIKKVLENLEAVSLRCCFVLDSFSHKAEDLVKNIESTLLFKHVVDPVGSFSTEHAKKREIDIIIDRGDIVKLSPVYCDQYASQIAFHIVIDNAIKYSRKNSTIKVYGKEDHEYCKISIESKSDIGIKPEEEERIFHEYFRGEAAEKKRYQGTGIGLHIAKEIMRRNNNGDIKLIRANDPTTFQLLFKKEKDLITQKEIE